MVIQLVIIGEKHPCSIDFFLIKYIFFFADDSCASFGHKERRIVIFSIYGNGEPAIKTVFYKYFVGIIKGWVVPQKQLFIYGIYRSISGIYPSQIGDFSYIIIADIDLFLYYLREVFYFIGFGENGL